jgi:hypothetical protein
MRRLLATAALSVLSLAPFAAEAACCICTVNGTSNQVCLTDANLSCADMVKGSGNDKIMGKVTCKPAAIGDTACKPASDGGVCRQEPFPAASYDPQAALSNTAPTVAPPKLMVPIPGLTFAERIDTSGGTLNIPFLAQYVAAAYRYLLGVSLVACAIMVTYGGLLYLLGETAGNASKGKDYIQDALVGVLLLFGSYAILNLVGGTAVVFPKAISVTAVTSELYRFMENEGGFAFGDPGAQQDLARKGAGYAGGTGGAIDPISSREKPGGVDISQIVETGTRASERLNSYCTSPADRSKLETYDDKTTALVRAILGFNKICIKEKNCAYVRTGFTAIPQGTVASGIKDFPFLWAFFEKNVPDAPLSEECKSGWAALKNENGSAGFYNAFTARATKKEYDKRYDLYLGAGGTCYDSLNAIYKSELTDPMTTAGLVGGDCGSIIDQVYRCAGGSVGRPFQGQISTFYYINYSLVSTNPPGQSPGPEFPVWQAQDMEDLRRQYNAAGGPKFGDVFVIGQFGKGQHNFIYTGGRSDVPFDILEMGGGGDFDGTVGAQVKITRSSGASYIMGGMRTHPEGGLYTYIENFGRPNCSKLRGKALTFCLSQKGKSWPVTVARPYNYTSCTSKDQCPVNQACLCTTASSGKIGVYKENCSLKNICHQPVSESFMKKSSLFCKDDEMCPRGWRCDTEKAQRCVLQ